MARPPATAADEAFLREVDEGLRRDQIAAAARRWGRIAIVAVGLALAALGGFLYWQHRGEQRRGVEGEQLQAALEDFDAGRTRQAATALAPLEQAGADGTRASARLAQAELLLGNSDMKGALARFGAIADDGALAQPFRDYATLRRTAIEFDTLPPQQVIERLQPLTVSAKPWFGSAGEMTAIAYLRQNRRDLAGRLFGQVARADGVPDSIRQRAVQMAGLLGVDAAPSAGATPTP